MVLLGKLRLQSFVAQHEDSRVPLSAWQLEAEDAQWAGPQDVEARYTDALVQPDQVVFSFKDIYKLAVKAKFKEGILFVERVWTTKVSKASRSTARSAATRRQA